MTAPLGPVMTVFIGFCTGVLGGLRGHPPQGAVCVSQGTVGAA